MNHVFKTVWNRVRRCYVAVNETVTGARQANGKTSACMVALVMLPNLVLATEINSDAVISGSHSYTDLTLNGANQTTNGMRVDGGEYSKRGLGIPHSAWRALSKFRNETRLSNQNHNLVIAENANISVGNTLALGKITHTYNGKWHITVDHYKKECHDCGYKYDFTDGHDFDFSKQENVFTDLVNKGNISAQRLVFVSPDNKLRQEKGIASFNSFSGNGTIEVVGGQLNLGLLNSNARVSATGGHIVADRIDLNSKTFASTNTKLSTGLNQVANFQQIIAQAQSLLIGSNDASRSLNASIIGREEAVNGLLAKFRDNVTWSGGAFHFKGSYTQTVANTARQLIQNTYGSNVGVSFDQIVDEPTPADVTNGLTAAIANAIMVENGTTGGAVFTGYKLDALANATTVGGAKGTHNVDTSIGFRSVNGNADVTVTGGKELVFLGEGAGRTIASGKLIADNGVLRLGTGNTSVAVGGTVADVDLLNNGTFETERGVFVANDVAGTGHVLVTSGVLNVNKLNIEGNVTNRGTLNLANGATWTGGHNAGTLTTSGFTASGSFLNANGVWILGEKPTFLTGTQINNENGTLKTTFGNLFDNGTGAELDGLHTIGRQAVVPQEIRETLTDLFTKYVPGSVKEDVLAHMTFNGAGKVVITNANLTTTQRDDLVKAFKEKIVAL